MTEELKDRWNGEIEHAVRRLQTTDWDAVRQRWERRIGNVFQRVKESDAGRDITAATDRLTEKIAGAAEGTKEAAKDSAAKKTTGPRLLELK